MPRSPYDRARGRRLLRPLRLGLLLALLAGTALAAPEEPPEKRLADAHFLEKTQSRHAEARDVYVAVLGAPGLPPTLRGKALLGAARCEVALGRPAEAERFYDLILADRDLPEDVRSQATTWKAAKITERGETQARQEREEAIQRELAEARRIRQELALPYLEDARLALRQGRLEAARQHVYSALGYDPESADATALLAEIEEKSPDRMELLRSMIEFFYSSRIEGHQRLVARIESLNVEGRQLFVQKQWQQADEKFRTAIALIDQSMFLSDLADARADLGVWLRRTLEEGRKAGLTLAPEPPVPDASARESDIRGRFFQLLAELFTSQDDTGDPLVVYEVAPAPVPRSSIDRSLGPNTFSPAGISVARSAGTITRAEWAERFVPANVDPGSWPTARPSGSRREPSKERRLLVRHGTHLVVQHTKTTQDRVAHVVTSFEQRPGPMQVDVAVFAASEGGTVSASSRLRAQAVPQESGIDLVVSGRLWKDATEELAALEKKYLTLLGTAQLVLRGETAATLELTQLTEKHPLHANLKPPPLTVPDADARYGLWFELYAEDLPHAQGIPRSAAVSVRARSRMVLPSVVVPKTRQALEQTRLPRFAEQVVVTDRRIPHFGTLLLLGVANPFSPTSATQPDLVILIGVRPAAREGGPAPTPDPPRALPTGPAPAEDLPERAHFLGTLATEVVDDVTLEGWPQRPATLPVPATAVAQDRATILAQLLAEMAGVWSPQSDQQNPITITEGTAYARLPADAQERVAAAALRLAAVENAQYEVDVVSTETTEDRANAWIRLPGVQKLTDGRYVVDARSAESLDGQMRANDDAASWYATRSTLQARATQKVAARQIRLSTIVEDLRPRRSSDGSLRYVPTTGRVEEGLVVEAQPYLEDAGRRLVRVRVRAARLESIEPVPMGEGDGKGPSVQLPHWYPVGDYSAAAPLADGEAILLLLHTPEANARVIAVKVTTRRVQ